MESAITSRLTREHFIPSATMLMPSEIDTVLNSIGVPPAARIPSLTLAARRRRWKLHGPISIHVFATPIMGRDKSSSEKPTAFNIARDDAGSGPSVITRLRGFRFSAIKYSLLQLAQTPN